MTENVFELIKNYNPISKWRYIIIHHSATALSTTWENIKKYHVEKNKWKDIGYNYGLEDNKFKIGRPLTMNGAHCKGMNSIAIGICVIGDYDTMEPTHQQYFLTASLCRALMDKFSIEIKNVLPHWAFSNIKTCPGKKFDILKLRDYIKGVTLKNVA